MAIQQRKYKSGNGNIKICKPAESRTSNQARLWMPNTRQA